MNKIVDTGLKVDLHIHSAQSKHKDGAKINYNTIVNIKTLVKKMTENEVNICAITDHDTFDYKLYKTLKREEQEDNSIKKVLPGVEFSVQFDNNLEAKVIHIVTLFNDSDDEKIKKIEDVLKFKNDKPNYDCSEFAFTEEKYLSLLRQINIDIIMIAHQKNSLTTTGKANKCDAASLGNEKFNEFLFTEYFEAYEFRNKKNEIFNKNYIFNNNVEDELRFITGSDCHNWSVYPNEDLNSAKEFSFTYVKCLPTFKGLVMAITDHRRIKLVNSFFDPSAYSIDKLDIEINGENIQVPLSKGLNVIIGDNSIGKSLLLHEITNYTKPCPMALKKGYIKYLSDNHIVIKTKLHLDNIFYCDMQGEIRKKFEENSLKGSDFLKLYFPDNVDALVYKSQIDRELNRFYEAINHKFNFEEKMQKLPKFKFLESDQDSQSLTFVNEVKQQKNKELEKLLGDLNPLENILGIREKLLDQFKGMGEIRQVIMISHNPQFIVNLDVDNVVFLTRNNDVFTVRSGALEYEDSECNILQLVAENIEGGLDTISRRLKRYEKGI